jgi:hypothetical protein
LDFDDQYCPSERYYTRPAFVLDPENGHCSKVDVALVGLHIVQKTPTRPQWIWSTFEHVDNVPPPAAGGHGTFNFNDGKGGPMPKTNPYPIDALPLPTPVAFNVQRLMGIDSRTQETNVEYRNLLNTVGSKWQFYQLGRNGLLRLRVQTYQLIQSILFQGKIQARHLQT